MISTFSFPYTPDDAIRSTLTFTPVFLLNSSMAGIVFEWASPVSIIKVRVFLFSIDGTSSRLNLASSAKLLTVTTKNTNQIKNSNCSFHKHGLLFLCFWFCTCDCNKCCNDIMSLQDDNIVIQIIVKQKINITLDKIHHIILIIQRFNPVVAILI